MNANMKVKAPHTLREALERVVRSRTGGLVRSLRVDVIDGEIIISGRAMTYYAKQLATHAALSLGEQLTVCNNIEVG